MLKLPGLVDVHTHLRVPGAAHKEDFDSGTAAALAGGITQVLAMPNTAPPIADAAALDAALDLAAAQARCDYGVYAVTTAGNVDTVHALAPRVAGLKIYLDATFGDLLMDDTSVWMKHLEAWPCGDGAPPIAVHAEQRTLAAVLACARLAERPIHVCHVARREEIELIARAKDAGWAVTCEAAPHHLMLCTDDLPRITAGGAHPGRGEVRPKLVSAADREALWSHLDVIDCIATDHAPHLLSEKDSDTPPPGFPELEVSLACMLTAVHDGRLTLEQLTDRMAHNPRRIFNLPEQPDTHIEVDPDAAWAVPLQGWQTRADWSPFAGMTLRGRVGRVVLRGRTAFEGGSVIAEPGTARDVRAARCDV